MANHHKRSAGRQPADSTVADPPLYDNNEGAEDAENTAAETSQVPQGGAETPRPHGKASTLNINDLKDMSIQKLTQVAKDLNVAGATGMRKQDLIFQILKA